MNRIGPACIALTGSLAACALLSPFAAQAACMGQWDLSGQWTLTQSNGYTVTLDLQQTPGNEIKGSAASKARKIG